MDFRTEIKLEKSYMPWDINEKISLIGSCFSQSIGNKLQLGGFSNDINPYGIIYNPITISECIIRVANNQPFDENDLILVDGYYKSYSHHGDFRAKTKEDSLKAINNRINSSHEFLINSNYLIITLGTSWIYTYTENNKIMGNCHKIPSKFFDKRLLSMEEIIYSLNNSFDVFFKKNKTKSPKIIISISPVRHWNDGFRGNQISKSILHIACNEILSKNNNIEYFPSYEILIDDLRDYRYYDIDMLHPSQMGVDYIWDKFSSKYFSNKTISLVKEYEKLNKMKDHKPLNPQSKNYKEHLDKIKRKEKELLALRIH